MQSSQTKLIGFANLNNESRKFANSIAVFTVCLSAIVIGQGCTNLGAIRQVDVGFGGLEIETWEPNEFNNQEYRRSTNGVWYRK